MELLADELQPNTSAGKKATAKLEAEVKLDTAD
jgi:hypothetical protein